MLAGRYRIRSALGEGGMGIVYHARDLTLDADVALKLLHPDIAHDPDRLAFFRNEVRVARMVTHANVCRLHDLEDGPDGCFITMEYIEGDSLSTRLRRGRMPFVEGLRVVHDVAAGLAAAHAAGVIHRDLKPSNVLLAGARVVVADFGIAGEGRLLGAGPQDIAGTDGYMAPEQARGGALDARADVYALGVLACVVLTGTRPRPELTNVTASAGGSAAAIPVIDPRHHLEALPPELNDLISRCLASDPAERPANAGEVVRELEALPLARVRARWWMATAALTVVIGLVVAGYLVTTRRTRPAGDAPRIQIIQLDTSLLAADQRWEGPAVQHMIVNELTDGWGIEAEQGRAGAETTGTISIAGKLSRTPSGHVRLELEGESFEAKTTRELAVTAAARIVDTHVASERRHPNAEDLRDAGAVDAEAWRLWRRAQREALMQRWRRARTLCEQALARDPGFSLAELERAMNNDRDDALAARELSSAVQMMEARPPRRPAWSLVATYMRQAMKGDAAGATHSYQQLNALPLDPWERLYFDVRRPMALYYGGDQHAAIPALELAVEKYATDPSAPKLLGSFYLASDEPSAPGLAVRYGTRAVELAPEDAEARANLALAYLLTGREDAARALAAELANADVEDKRSARLAIYQLHMAVGEPGEAEVDARRLLTGTEGERAEGDAALALLDLYWGRFDRGISALLANSDEFAALGETTSSARQAYLAGHNAALLGDREIAATAFAGVVARHGLDAPLASVRESIAAGKLDEARARANAIPTGSTARANAQLAIAIVDGPPSSVVTGYENVSATSTSIEFLFDVADALEQTGRIDDAAAAFDRLAHSPRGWREPIATTRAWYRLGLLRERSGDRAGARKAYNEVVRRWASATRAMPELADARRRSSTP